MGSGRLRAVAYGDRLLVQSESGASADRLTLRWAREGASANSIARVGAHGLLDWISTGSARVGGWTVRRNGTSVEASRVQR